LTGALSSRPRLDRRIAVGRALAALAAFAAVVATALPASAQTAAPWPEFQGGPERQGLAPAGTPDPALRLAWRTKAPGTDGRLSMPVVTPDVAVAVGRTAVVGLDPTDGTVQWQVPRNAGLAVPPVLAAGSSGDLIVYVEGDAASTSALVALDLQSHDRAWRFALDSPAPWSPAVLGDGVVVGTLKGTLTLVSVADGTATWKATAPGPITSVAASGDRVFVVSEEAGSGTGALSAFDAASGRRQWTKSYRLASLTSAPAVTGSTVVVAFGNGLVRALDAATGADRWSQPIRSRCSPRSGLAVADGAVFVADVQGGVYRFDLNTGAPAWDYQLAAFNRWGSPLVAGSALYLGMEEGHDGLLVALRLSDGHLVWQRRTAGGPLGALAPSGDLLLAPAEAVAGGLLAFARDPAGVLTDTTSPTELHLGTALLGFAVAFLVLGAALLALGRFVARSGVPTEIPPPGAAPEGGGA
jgi:outer membrane protein assembly factor BamB